MTNSPTRTPLLSVRDLRCHIATPTGTVRAVDGVSLTLYRGQVYGLVGESGCGKSTLVRAIAGLRGPQDRISGQVEMDGVDLSGLSAGEARRFRGKRVGMVFQDPMTALNPVVPIGRQLTEGMRTHLLLDRGAAQRRAVELLARVGVPDALTRLRHYPHQFSGGLRQRITIAMALSCEPDLLIADEATTALDVTVQRQILDLLAGLSRERGMAMILVSHDLGVVAGRASQVAVMYAGRIVEHGPTARLFAQPRHRYTEALLDAIPRLDHAPHTRLRVIAGMPPNLVSPPSGCAFAPRCPTADSDCVDQAPALGGGGFDGHRHACRHPASATHHREVRP